MFGFDTIGSLARFTRGWRRANGRLRRSGHGVEPDEIFIDAALGGADSASGLERIIERPLGRLSSTLFFLLSAVGLVYLGVRGFSLQIASGETFFHRAQENRFVTRTLYAPRGIIRDRFGEVLVENLPSFGLVLEPKEFIKSGGDLSALTAVMEEVLGRPIEYADGFGLSKEEDYNRLPPRVFLGRDLSAEEVSAVSRRLAAFQGIEIFESFRRVYRDPYAYSHLMGFVGRVSPEDLDSQPELGNEEVVGKAGIEAFYDRTLRGNKGKKIVEVDSRGAETRHRLTQEPGAGQELNLTIDGELQEEVYRLIQDYTGGKRAASVVALDPRSGAVRALVSFPGFEANRFGQGLEADAFEDILHDPLTPLFNRAIAGEFPSGSTIKPLIAVAALEEHLIDPKKKIYDPGFIEIPNPYQPGQSTRFLDWRAHGWVDLYDAIAYSANVYFYMVGGGYKEQRGLGIEKIKQYAALFGLGSQLGLDLPGEKPGLVPDPEWKKMAEPRDPIWRLGDTYHVAIGQGGVKAPPLQMASLTAAIANGGTLWQPYLLQEVRDQEGKAVEKKSPHPIRNNIVSQASLVDVVDGMRKTVTVGTARLMAQVPVGVAAKTGTAEVGGGKPAHAWVTAFAPAEKPEIAIAVMVEHAGEGATVAVPITNEILKWYFMHQDRIKNQE